MKTPSCRNIVETKNLWQIGIEFIRRIDEDLIEYNLILAYITYKLSKLEGVPNKNIKRLVFVSCFNDIGILKSKEGDASSEIETYLFLKYFSPLKDNANLVLVKKNVKPLSGYYADGMRLNVAKDFTKELIKLKDKDMAYKKIVDNKDQYSAIDVLALSKLVNKTDIFYEINSMHYKTVIYKYISKMLFNPREKENFITMLASLFEMYSLQTLSHSKVTAYIAYSISKKMKLKKINQKKIYVAGLCHDLGKVSVPLKILEKPDKLTDSEYTKMKKHVTYTKEILDGKVDFDIVEIAYRHHERLDGLGYPNKIKGNNLTVDQKILQVADVISALIAKRSYKEAWSIDKTISILDMNASEGKLDKDIIELFKTNKDKILKESNKLIEQADKVYSKINEERVNLSKEK